MLAVARHWWVPTVRGVLAIVFGILAIVWPGLALVTLATVFGIFALLDGIVALAGLFMGRTTEVPWYMLLLAGVTGIVAGIVALAYPGLTTVALLSFVAAYALLTGIAHLASAIQQRDKAGSPPLAVAGCVAILFGVMMLWRPDAGALAVAWLIGVYAIVVGAAQVTMGMTLRGARGLGERLTATLIPEERKVPK